MLETKFGPMAQDGNFVLVVDFNYMKRKCDTYIARVYKNTAYTGMKKVPYDSHYIHKKVALAVIPESYVPSETKDKIYEDMAIHNPNTVKYDAERRILWVK